MTKQVVCFDIQFTAELIKALDDKVALYSKEMDEQDKDQNSMEIEVSFSSFPLLPTCFFVSVYPLLYADIGLITNGRPLSKFRIFSLDLDSSFHELHFSTW